MDLTISKIDKIADVLEVSTSEILNFDPAKIFNISNNDNSNGVFNNENNYYYTVDPHTKKYITLLEEENERLKKNQKEN